jgi:hypothetical protein
MVKSNNASNTKDNNHIDDVKSNHDDNNNNNPNNTSNNNNNTNNNETKNVNKASSKKVDEIMELISSQREITQEEVNSAPLLILDEDKNGNLFNKQQIKINAAGLIGGRGAKDGVAIFGIINNTNTNFKADFDLNYNTTSPLPYVFTIYYHRENKKYYIRAYSGKNTDNRILFVKLSGNYSHNITQKEIISAGNVIFQVSPLENNKIEIGNLSRKEGNDNHKLTFDPLTVKEVTIGRDSKCTFAFPKDKSFSRCHTTFTWDDGERLWKIIDGSKNKSSTNGTWVFGTHSFQIQDQMVVEILTSKIRFSVMQNSDK